MLNWVQSWNQQDLPSQVKTREGKRKILLSADTDEVTLSCSLRQVIQRRKNLKIYVTGEARVSRNENDM